MGIVLFLMLLVSAASFGVSAYEIAFHGFTPSKWSMVIAFVIAGWEVLLSAFKTLDGEK